MHFLKFRFHFIILLIVCIFNSCGGDNSDLSPNPDTQNNVILHPATFVKLSDIANYRDGRDFKISFSSSSTNIAEFKIFIAKSINVGSVTLNFLKTNNNYAVFQNTTFQGNLTSDFKDLDGDLIKEDIEYKAFVLSVPILGLGLSEVMSFGSESKKLEQITVVRTLAKIEGAGTGGMDADESGNIYMGDFGVDTNGGGSKVYKITPEGNVSLFSTGYNTASGNDFDSQGNLFQSSFDGKFISKIDQSGNTEKFVSHNLITGPVGIAIDNMDNLFVADYRSNKILKITKDKSVTVFSNSTHLDGPNGLDFDSNGNLYVSNWNNSKIVKISAIGNVQVFANTSNNNAHLLIKNGFIYVVGRPKHNIFKIDLNNAEVVNLINNGRGTRDGLLSEAQLSYPNDIAFNKEGNLMYINHVNTGPNNGFTLTPTIIRVVDFAK